MLPSRHSPIALFMWFNQGCFTTKAAVFGSESLIIISELTFTFAVQYRLPNHHDGRILRIFLSR
jgi:hypothetical protein